MNINHLFLVLLGTSLLFSSCGISPEHADIPPAATPSPNPILTVCASGCTFQLIQDAINAEDTQPGTIIEVKDPVHTEAGIQVRKNIIIQGQGSKATIVQAHPNPGEGTQRIFEVPPDVTITIRGMTVRHGNPKATPLTGGGILNYGTLTLEDTVVSENFGSAGGGIYNEGTLTLITAPSAIMGLLAAGMLTLNVPPAAA